VTLTPAVTVTERAKKVRMLIFDIDGVMTDGSLYYADGGEEMKAFHVRDGLGIKLAQAAGLTAAIITGRDSPLVKQRAHDLGIAHLIQGAGDKAAAFAGLLERCGMRADETAFVGDDIVDLPVLKRCGLAVAVADATGLVKQQAHYVTHAHGGRGAVREVCELVLQAQGSLARVMEPYLR
jgi:3-deoxy-D-manno-octulosonate 8-phosphate phosphatase (KDO 8-P phosphatase)